MIFFRARKLLVAILFIASGPNYMDESQIMGPWLSINWRRLRGWMKAVCVSNILGWFLIPCWKAIVANMIKCPRCKLPQTGIYKCQYCGYNLEKYNKKPTTIIRKRLKDIIGGFKKDQIVSSNNKSKVHSMNYVGKAEKSTDNFGSRAGTDRRKQKYTIDFSERRSGMDRRKWFDFRSSIARKRRFESRFRVNHQESYAIKQRGTL